MKVAFCTNYFSPCTGGAEKVSEKIVDYLAVNGCEVHVFTRRVPNRSHKNFTKYAVRDYLPGDVNAFEKALKAFEPQVVIVYSDVFDYFRLLATQKHSFKVILCLCGANWLLQNKNFVNAMYRNLDNIHKLVCHSMVTQDYRLICSSSRFKDKAAVINNGVDLTEFDDNHLTRTDLLPEHKNKIWLLNVSNFFPGKGQEHIISLLSNTPNPERFVYVQVCSDMQFAVGQQLENKWKVAARKIEERGVVVKLMKNISREKIIGLYKQSNLFIFTSEQEVAPLCVLEAMAAGLPWISANVGNVEELKGGECIVGAKNMNGRIVFNSYMFERFQQGMEKMLSQPSIGESGRMDVEKNFVWDKILPSYLSLVLN